MGVDLCDGQWRRDRRPPAQEAPSLEAEDACREVELWVTETELEPIRWEIADDETLVGRIRGHFAVVSSL